MRNTKISFCSVIVLLIAALGCFDTAVAQSTLTANPPSLTFNTQSGVTTTSQTVLITSPVPAAVTVSALSTNNWLTVTPTSGTTPVSVTVSLSSSAPTSGTNVGYINISSSSAGSLTIPVTLNANSTGTSSLTANPNSLSFTFPAGSTVASTQTVSVSSSSSSVTTFTAAGTTANNGSWLTVNPQSGSVPGSFQVTVNPTALGGAGSFDAAVAINAPGTTGTVVPILVTLQGTPALTVTPSQLSFGYQIGTNLPGAQTLTVTSSTGANVGFTATPQTTTCGSNWLVVSQSSGVTPSTLTVQVNTSGLSAGPACSGDVVITSAGTSNPTITVPVSLLVSTNPLLQIPSAGPAFNYQIGGTVPASQNVSITSSTSGVSFTATATPISGGQAFLQVSPSSATTPQSIALSLNPTVIAALGPGTYSENVTISAAGAGNSPQTFPVTLVVSSNPALISNLSALNFNYQLGQAHPSSQTLTITSSGAPLNYQVSTTTTNCAGFLTATPASGSTFGNTNQNQVFVSINTTGLSASQVCTGDVVLTVPGSSTSLQIPVNLYVSNSVLLNVGQSAINVTALAGSTTLTQQTIAVTATDNSVQTFSATASTNPAGLTWLSVTPNSGTTPSNALVTINPSGLAVGTYTGSVTIQGTGGAATAPPQVIPVTLTIASAAVSATPTTLSFTQSTGGTAPASQTIQIAGVPAGTTVGAVGTVFNGTGWLTASVSGSTVTVSANGSQLTQGTYNGVVTVIVPGTQGSPLNIPVTLTVGAAPMLSVSPAAINFSYQLGSTATVPAQTVQVTSTGVSVPFTASFTPTTGGAFVTVTPTSGTTPGTLSIALNPSDVLASGTYSGTITVASTAVSGGNQTIPVALTVVAGTTPVVTAVVNAASMQPGAIAPGEIISIFGTNVGPVSPTSGTGFQPTSSDTVPTTLAGTTVTINNVQAPLIFVGPNQINAIVPYQLAGQSTANVTVSINGATSASFQTQVVNTAPAIFSLAESGSGQGAILNQNGSVNSSSNPAAKGSIIQIFGTGEGQLVPAQQTGCFNALTLPLPVPVATPVSVTIGGQPSPQITYAGEAPGLVCGAIQINAVVPTNIASGAQPIVLTIGSNTNNQQNVTVAVQ